MNEEFDARVRAAIDEVGALTMTLGEKYGGEALLLALARNTAYAMRTLPEKARRVVLKNIEDFAFSSSENGIPEHA